MLKLNPVFKDYIWGGEKLKKLFGKQCEGILAESWEASIHPDGLSQTENGTFLQYLQSNPNAVDGKCGTFDILIKFIDSKQNLSVQVHPDNDYARRVENDNGKTETWYIVDAEDGAGIYFGFNQDVDKKEFLRSLEDGTVEQLLNFVPVRKGDCFFIQPGTVHAICAGCVICEVQQSSNVTYRVYDYNRVDAKGNKRPLHVQKAMDVINFSKCNNAKVQGGALMVEEGKNLLDETVCPPSSNANIVRQLAKCQYFNCKEVTLKCDAVIGCNTSYTVINMVGGCGKINDTDFVAGDTFFLDCGERATIVGDATLIVTTK